MKIFFKKLEGFFDSHFILFLITIILLIFGFLYLVIYYGYNTEEKYVKNLSNTSNFCFIEKGDGFKIFYNKETRVMYIISCGSYNTGNATVMLNADGTPQLYEGDSNEE